MHCQQILAALLAASLTLASAPRANASDTPISLASLLTEMTDRNALARFPSPAYTSLQASSYDRKSTSIDNADSWFANADVNQYIRQEVTDGRTEWVMMDAPGPGAIVRIWSANPNGTLRVYLDNQPTPAIEARMSDVLGGKWKAPGTLSYEASKGWNLYLPIPYAKHCKITSDQDGFYYHVNYRSYANGTHVETFSAKALDDAAPDLARVNTELAQDRSHGITPSGSGETPANLHANINGGSSISLELPVGARAVTAMSLQITGDSPAAPDVDQRLRSCVLEAEFDGQPTIWCPVADFFGSGVGAGQYQDWYRAVGPAAMMRCRWVMPYQKSGKLTIRNLGASPVSVNLGVLTKPWTWDDRSMHFHAVWRDEYPVHALGARGTSDFNYVDIKGKGVYVGDVLSIMNPVKEWWGEGDEKIYVDGETFPSHFGTGTEDYYGYAWCWPDTFSRPFHAQPRCDGEALKNNWGRSVVTRSRSLDAIPFTTGLSMNMEVWHWKACQVEYASTAYFYALPGATTNRQPDPAAASRPLVQAPPLPPPLEIKGAIEFETMSVASKSAGVEASAQGGFGPELWSKGQQLWVRAAKPGDFVEFRIPAAAGGRLLLHATRSWDYGIVRVTVNGKPSGPDLDLCSGKREVVPTGPLDLGNFEPKDGLLVLRCELVGASAKAEGAGSYFGLDCLVIEAPR